MHWQLLCHKAELKEAVTICSSCPWEHEEAWDVDVSPVGTAVQKNPAWATWDSQAPPTHIQSRTETPLKNLHVKWKAGNSQSLYSQCKVSETENSCDTPTIRLADMAMVCQVAHRLAEHGHIAAMSPCVGQSLRTDLPHLCFKRGTPKCLWHLGGWLTTRQNNKLEPGKQLLSVNTKQQQTKKQNCWKQNVE